MTYYLLFILVVGAERLVELAVARLSPQQRHLHGPPLRRRERPSASPDTERSRSASATCARPASDGTGRDDST